MNIYWIYKICKKKILIAQISLIIVLLFLFFSISLPGQAITGLTIAPATKEIQLKPNETFKGRIKLFNSGDESTTYYPLVRDIWFKDKEGKQLELLEPTEQARSFSLAFWIKFPQDSITLEPKENKEIDYEIFVPENAESGGHYGGIFFTTSPIKLEDKNVAVGVTGKIGTIILGKVSGDIKEEGRIKEFSASKKIYEHLPVNFTVRFENLGNVHIKPSGAITIFKKDQRLAEIPVNEKLYTVLPGSIKKFDVTRNDENIKFGKFRAKLAATNITQGGGQNNEIIFWIIPWKKILIGFIGLVFLIVLIIFGIKKYNKWLVRKAGLKPGAREKKMEKEKRSFLARFKNGIRLILIKIKKKLLKHKKYFRLIFLIIIFCVLILVLVFASRYLYQRYIYLKDVKEEQSFEKEKQIEEFAKQKKKQVEEENIQITKIEIFNGNGIEGCVEKTNKYFEEKEISIKNAGNAENFDYFNTVIKYRPEKLSEAEQIRDILSLQESAKISSFQLEKVEDLNQDIIVILGKDMLCK